MTTLAPEPALSSQALYSQIENWLGNADGWRVTYGVVRPNSYRHPDAEDVYGLIIEALDGEGRIHLQPLRSDRQGTPLIEMYALPTLVRVRLREQSDGSWEIETDGGIPFRQPWNKDTFQVLVKDWNKDTFQVLVKDMLRVQ